MSDSDNISPIVFEDIPDGIDGFEPPEPCWYMSSMNKVGLLKWRCQLDIAFDDESLLVNLVGRTMTKAGALKQLRAFAQEAGLIDFAPNNDGFDYRDYDGEWEEIMEEMMEAEYGSDA
jgi:hypothetical protein